MKILVLNSGSSSLKYQVIDMDTEEMLVKGYFERIGIGDSFYSIKLNGEKIKKERELNNHSDAVKILCDECGE